MSNQHLYFVTGISGSGKTTIARKLIENGYVAFDSKINKSIFHFVDRNGQQAPDYRPKDKDWAKRYKWVLNKPMLNQLLSQHKDAKCIFLCGRGNIRQHWSLAEKVFLLNVDAETMLERLKSPTRDNPWAKDRATQIKLTKDLEFVQRSLTNAGAVVIDATQPIDSVVSYILAHTVCA